jgi:hypothetical protein
MAISWLRITACRKKKKSLVPQGTNNQVANKWVVASAGLERHSAAWF